MSYLNRLNTDLSGLKVSADYWDVRIEDTFETTIAMVDGEIVTCTSSPSVGAFVRVRREGFWFYESTTDLSRLKETLEKLSKQPTRFGKKGDTLKAEKHAPHIAVTASGIKFSAVGLEQKLDLARKYDSVMAGLDKVASRNIRYKDVYKMKSFLNSVGTQFEYDFNQGGMMCIFTLKDGDLLFDDFMRLYGSQFSELQNHEEELKKVVAEARRFLHAPAIQPGKYKVVLDPEVAGVFTHESFGHKSEADFMLGNQEAIEEWKIGKKIGADCLTIVDNGLHAGTSGYCPIDDDGTPAQKNYLIKNGVLAGRLHSRETAYKLGEKPTGNSRAMNFEFEPIVRMTSTYIEAGKEDIDTIIKRSEGAILVEGVKHGSGLSTFTIAPTRGYRIGKGGEKEPVRLTVLSGSVFETLKNIEAVSSDFSLESSALGGCGKMEQWPLPVADGGPYVVVANMQVS
jgi:TldD protein